MPSATDVSSSPADPPTWRSLPAPPLPHEHGAWAMLYVPLLLALGALEPIRALPTLLLILAVTAAFFTQNAALLLLRRRGGEGAVLWLAIDLVLLGAGGLPLLLVYGRLQLLALGLVGLLFFAYYAHVTCRPGLKKLVRSEWSELITIGTLALTAPAAYVVARGSLDARAWAIWAGCVLYFASSVFYVKMWFAAARQRAAFTTAARARAALPSASYHLVLAALVAVVAVMLGGVPGMLLGASFTPIVIRALHGSVRLRPIVPPLRRLGILEAIYSVWFAGCWIGMLRLLEI